MSRSCLVRGEKPAQERRGQMGGAEEAQIVEAVGWGKYDWLAGVMERVKRRQK